MVQTRIWNLILFKETNLTCELVEVCHQLPKRPLEKSTDQAKPSLLDPLQRRGTPLWQSLMSQRGGPQRSFAGFCCWGGVSTKGFKAGLSRQRTDCELDKIYDIIYFGLVGATSMRLEVNLESELLCDQ